MKNSNIQRYLVMLVTFLVVKIVLDLIIEDASHLNFWKEFLEGIVFCLAVIIIDVAEKHDWDTWSGLFRKLKKNK